MRSSSRRAKALQGLQYEPAFLHEAWADQLLAHCLLSLPWREELVQMFGRTFVAPRISCAVADPGCSYRYRGSQMESVRFSKHLNTLRESLCDYLDVPFNYALVTQYRNGTDYVGWHADDERDLMPDQAIANISLGATREFRIKSRDGTWDERVYTEHGSLLVMHGDIHRNSKHTLVKTRQSVGVRVVLSFRQVQA